MKGGALTFDTPMQKCFAGSALPVRQFNALGYHLYFYWNFNVARLMVGFQTRCKVVLQEAAASKRGVPLLLTPSLRVRDVLWALRPALLDRSLISTSRDHMQGGRKVVWMTRSPLPGETDSSIPRPDAAATTLQGTNSQQSSGENGLSEAALMAVEPQCVQHKSLVGTLAQGTESAHSKAAASSPATGKEWSQHIVQYQEQLLRGSITVSDYILLCKTN
eukprot:1157736-Pelagomonas_calceolata.AAC.1